MGAYTLQLFEDHLGSTVVRELAPAPRVVYVLSGDLAVTSDGPRVTVSANQVWHGARGGALAAGSNGATMLRWEMIRGTTSTANARSGTSRVVLTHPIALDDAGEYLMRCDRVDFGPGGEALPHGHKGGGIRWLITGELDVRVDGRPGRVMKPGDAWFESGIEPVHAIASSTDPTSFIRVSILPRAIRGQSSIVYVDPAHAAVKPRQYTVFVDEPIALP